MLSSKLAAATGAALIVSRSLLPPLLEMLMLMQMLTMLRFNRLLMR